MIDLDPTLGPWRDAKPWETPMPGWGEAIAESIARFVARRHDLSVDWDPPDEEWVRILGSNETCAMVSTLFPLAITVEWLRDALAAVAANAVIIEVSDFHTEQLQASTDLLKATLLRYGWDPTFNTSAFCASDLFVESV